MKKQLFSSWSGLIPFLLAMLYDSHLPFLSIFLLFVDLRLPQGKIAFGLILQILARVCTNLLPSDIENRIHITDCSYNYYRLFHFHNF
jgi:hypothetical protein